MWRVIMLQSESRKEKANTVDELHNFGRELQRKDSTTEISLPHHGTKQEMLRSANEVLRYMRHCILSLYSNGVNAKTSYHRHRVLIAHIFDKQFKKRAALDAQSPFFFSK